VLFGSEPRFCPVINFDTAGHISGHGSDLDQRIRSRTVGGLSQRSLLARCTSTGAKMRRPQATRQRVASSELAQPVPGIAVGSGNWGAGARWGRQALECTGVFRSLRV
jgi:hypothetical protein